MTTFRESARRFDARELLRAHHAENLAPRVQFSAALVLVGALSFLVADIVFLEGRDLLAHALQVVAATLSGGVILALRSERGRRHSVRLATVYMSLVVTLVTVIGTLRGAARADVVLFAVILIGIAALLPWGLGPQLVICGIVAVGTVFNAWIVDGCLLQPFDIQVLVAMAFAIVVSLAVAYELLRTGRADLQQRQALERSEAQSREREGRLAMVLSSVPAVLWAVDRDLRLTSITGAPLAAQGFGDPGAWLGRQVQELVVDEPDAEALIDAVKAAAGGESICREARIGGEAFRIFAEPLRDAEGTGVGAIGTALNINDLKVAEKELTDLNAALEERVAERTAEIESFTYAVSHDLRQPLRGVNGYAAMIEESLGGGIDASTKQYLDRLRLGMEKMWGLIDGLLQLARVGGFEMNLEKVDVTAVADDLAEALRESDPSRTVRMRVERGLTAYGDAELIRLLLQNLLENSWKFTRDKQDASIELRGESHNGDFVTFCVVDNGAGFDMEHAGKLFGTFQRLHRDDEFAGTGIGLATVARIVSRHGGRVWAESHEGHGTTVHFTLPGHE